MRLLGGQDNPPSLLTAPRRIEWSVVSYWWLPRREGGSRTSSVIPPEMPQFEMTIDEVFEIPNRGLVVCGKATAGEIRVGDELFVHTDIAVVPVRVKFLEAFHNVGPQIRYAGDNVAAGNGGTERAAVHRRSPLTRRGGTPPTT